MVPIQEIVGIFDSRLLHDSEDNRKFMDTARRQGRIRSEVPTEDTKAVVVTATAVYTSAISSLTLQKRVTHVQWGLSQG